MKKITLTYLQRKTEMFPTSSTGDLGTPWHPCISDEIQDCLRAQSSKASTHSTVYYLTVCQTVSAPAFHSINLHILYYATHTCASTSVRLQSGGPPLVSNILFSASLDIFPGRYNLSGKAIFEANHGFVTLQQFSASTQKVCSCSNTKKNMTGILARIVDILKV